MKKLKEDDRFHFGGAECTVTKISGFGGTDHYGFTYCRIIPGHLDEFGSGWIPCTLLDAHLRQLEALSRPQLKDYDQQ